MKKKMVLIVSCLLTSILIGCGTKNDYNELAVDKEIVSSYECNVNACQFFMGIKTVINTTVDEKAVEISRDSFTIGTEPLSMKDEEGNVLASAGDVYGIISQDDHGIYVNDSFEINMCGNIDFNGESYELQDSEGNLIATVEFSTGNTSGGIIDTEGNLIATFKSDIGRYDYTVDIYENDIFSDNAILMIMASYMSDYRVEQRQR